MLGETLQRAIREKDVARYLVLAHRMGVPIPERGRIVDRLCDLTIPSVPPKTVTLIREEFVQLTETRLQERINTFTFDDIPVAQEIETCDMAWYRGVSQAVLNAISPRNRAWEYTRADVLDPEPRKVEEPLMCHVPPPYALTKWMRSIWPTVFCLRDSGDYRDGRFYTKQWVVVCRKLKRAPKTLVEILGDTDAIRSD